MATNVNNRPRVMFGPLASLPVLPKKGLPQGLSYICTDVDRAFYLVGTFGSQRWREYGSDATVTVYISPTGDPTVTGFSPSAPTTFANAFTQAAPGRFLIISCAAGTYPAATLAATWTLPPNCTIKLTGNNAWTTVRNGIVGVGSTTKSIVDQAGGMTVNAFQGRRLTVTSGNQNGKQMTVSRNDATHQIGNTTGLKAPPANNDTYIVEAPGAIFVIDESITAVSTVFDLTLEGALWFDAITLHFTSAGFSDTPAWYGGVFECTAVEWNFDESYAFPLTDGGCQITMGSRTLFPVAGVGCYIHGDNASVGSCWVASNGSFLMTDSVVDGFFFQFFNSQGTVTNNDIRGANAGIQFLACNVTGVFGNNFSGIVGTDNANAAVWVGLGSSVANGILSNTFASCTAGDCIRLSHNSTAQVRNNTGAGAGNTGGYGVSLLYGSEMVNTGGNTVTSDHDVQLGGAGNKTWAGVSSYINDLSAGTPQMCAVSTALF